MSSDPTTTNTATNAAGNPLPPLPADHLSHPEQWATGAEPATEKQKGFIKVLESKNPDAVPSEGLDVEGLGKSEASEVIEKLKNGQKVEQAGENDPAEKAEVQNVSGKRKAPASDEDNEKATAVDESGEKGEGSQKKEKAGASADDAIDVDATDATANDNKEAGQTTLDGAFKVPSNPMKNTTSTSNDNAEKEDGPSDSKKARLASSSDSTSKITNSNDGPPTSAADDTVPGDDDHLDHPENWTTGDEPATEKQKGYIKVLEKQKGAEGVAGNVDQLGKSEASEKIDELRST